MFLYFVRHAESEANLLRMVSNRGEMHPLTPRGINQAEELARCLAATRAEKIYTSPLLRAVQTADILAQFLHLPIETTPALREYDCGILEGKTDDQTWETHAQVREKWLNGCGWEEGIAEGESFVDIRERFVPFIERVVNEERGDLILVGHAGTYVCMLPLVLMNISFEFAARCGFPNTAYVLAETRPEGLVCVDWCGEKV